MARAKQIQDRRAKKREDTGNDRGVATNRRARHDYDIIDATECGKQALLFVCVLHAADGGADAYVDQVNRWLGFDALPRALEHR